MRVRTMDVNGDMTFGASGGNFLVNSPEAVKQCVLTALQLTQGDWFLDITAGVPWDTEVLGFNTQSLYDTAIRNAITGVIGVTAITSYNSELNRVTRKLIVTATIETAFGPLTIQTSLDFAPPLLTGYGVGGYAMNPYGE